MISLLHHKSGCSAQLTSIDQTTSHATFATLLLIQFFLCCSNVLPLFVQTESRIILVLLLTFRPALETGKKVGALVNRGKRNISSSSPRLAVEQVESASMVKMWFTLKPSRSVLVIRSLPLTMLMPRSTAHVRHICLPTVSMSSHRSFEI